MKQMVVLYIYLIYFYLIFLINGESIDFRSLDDLLLKLNIGKKKEPSYTEQRDFKYYWYEEIVKEIKILERKYGDLVQVFDAQSRYGLDSPGDCGSSPCLQYVVRITNEKTLPDPYRPEVFFSGELHGDEVVGPTSLIEMAKLLLETYSTNSSKHNPWLRKLVDTRSIYFMPTTNSIGYFKQLREENRIDPNRDFPIDSPRSCMETITARALNELFREHLFQVALTYHGGMQSIAFEWGTKTYIRNSISPDHISQSMLGSTMSAFAGKFVEGFYPHGSMNSQVYPVRGGMEDWAYAGSWYQSKSKCNPRTFGGYPSERIEYNDAVLRTLNILIETSKDKRPKSNTLGSNIQLLRPQGLGNGHISRNLRLALFMIDIVQPYIQWVSRIDENNLYTFSWEIGGAAFVDETYLEYYYQDVIQNRVHYSKTSTLQGNTRWNGGGFFNGVNNSINENALAGKKIEFNKTDDIDDREIWPFIPAFQVSIKIPEGMKLINVTAAAMVDQAWGQQPADTFPKKTKPQSHFVNARTNILWKKENNNHKVKGRLYWYSTSIRFHKLVNEEIEISQKSDTSKETTLKQQKESNATSLIKKDEENNAYAFIKKDENHTTSFIKKDENHTTSFIKKEVNHAFSNFEVISGFILLFISAIFCVKVIHNCLVARRKTRYIKYEAIEKMDE